MPWSNTRPRSADYGHEHTLARAAAARQHHDSDPCTRCGLPLGPMGRWLHYDHADDRQTYLGFSHERCNRNAGARKARAMQDMSPLVW